MCGVGVAGGEIKEFIVWAALAGPYYVSVGLYFLSAFCFIIVVSGKPKDYSINTTTKGPL